MSEKQVSANSRKDNAQLSKADIQLFLRLYRHRCLTLAQAWRISYKPLNYTFRKFFQEIIRKYASELHYITIQNYGDSDYSIQLTRAGLEAMRTALKIPKKVKNPETNIIKDPLLPIADVRIMPRLIPHQTSLNEFVLNFEEVYNRNNFPEKYRYFDEKYVSQYDLIRPDGLIRIGNLDLFLEQDMGTESRSQLSEKWNRYRRWLNVKKGHQRVVVLFIVKCEKENERKQLIRTTSSQVFTRLLDDNFDIYVGNIGEIMNTTFRKILPLYFSSYSVKETVIKPLRKHGFSISNARSLNVLFGGSAYGYYARKLSGEGVKIENGTAQEWLVDEYWNRPMSVLSKIDFAARTSSDFQLRYKRGIKYLVICKDLKEMYADLKAACTFPLKSVCFTTPARLYAMPLYEAICTISENGDVEHFLTTGFASKSFEYNIEENAK